MSDLDALFDQFIALVREPGTARQRFVIINGERCEALSAAASLPDQPLSDEHREAVATVIRARQISYRAAARNLAHLANSRASSARLRDALLAPLDHPKPSGPATDAVERMEAEIAADRQKRTP